MSLLEAISPTARMLLGSSGGGRMNFIIKPVAHTRTLRIHVKSAAAETRTLCGIVLERGQLDIGPANCLRCALCLRVRQLRRHIRGTTRLNGKRVSPNQIKLIA